MTRRKRSSLLLEKAERRASGMRSIDASLDLGNGMTLKSYQAALDSLRERQNRYNTLLSSIDQIYNELLEEERSLGELSENMLSAVKVKFGRNSTEYEMAGGVRRSERRRARRTVTEVVEPVA
ncbi:hypothetical protein [Pseudanabaena sp. FACHB-2040]|uniref:hypothetical protein n=1 Tax=Pseudanabaena sp. FACHB-2040 TaxID=2692859 RepID=UPI00168930A5|nr:hypothetical protein [Pseudanabaena sp. FACHB-2040]MBD2260600.1 hypothetical protein [Pseudanabaena sp. FACHB-2040]